MDFLTVGLVAGGSIVLLISLMTLITKNYIRIPPNKAAVIFGRKHKDADGTMRGYRLVQGGGVFKIPFFEQVEYMDLSNRQINIKVSKAPNKDGVMTDVDGIANVKFASDKELLITAVERFLSKDNAEVDKIIFQNLEGHLRSVVGKMTMEQLIGDKQKLNETILSEANEDFEKMGIKIDFLNIQDIRDEDNYIENLGRKRTAEISRDAEIGEAEARRETLIKASTAQREGVETENKNKQKIAESDRERDVVAARMKAEIDREAEIAKQAGPLSEAEALERVVKARAVTDAAEEKARIEVEKQRALKEEQRLYASTIVPAQAQKQTSIINAEGAREAKLIDADANKKSTVITAEGAKEATLRAAEAEAEATKMKALAVAAGEAAKIEQEGAAQASAIRAKLLAEAEGVEAKALAYEKLDATGKFLEVLVALQTLGPNLVREFAGVMAASTQHFKDIDEIKIVDFGGNSNGGSSLQKFGNVPTELITKLFEGAKGAGFDVKSLLNMVGIKPEENAPEVLMTTGKEVKSSKKGDSGTQKAG